MFETNNKPVKPISIDKLRKIISNYSNYALNDFLNIEKKLGSLKIDGHISNEILREYGRICLIKDEYQVAKMHINNYRKIAANEYDAWNKLSFYLAPPIFSFIKDKKTQNPKKFKIPGLIAIPIFHVLEKLSFLRGTPFDIFKYSRERKTDYEHKKVFEEEFFKLIDDSIEKEKLSELVQLSKQVKGFGKIKEGSFKTFRNKINSKNIRHLEI